MQFKLETSYYLAFEVVWPLLSKDKITVNIIRNIASIFAIFETSVSKQ